MFVTYGVQPIDQRRMSSYAVHRLTAYHNKSTPTHVISSNSCILIRSETAKLFGARDNRHMWVRLMTHAYSIRYETSIYFECDLVSCIAQCQLSSQNDTLCVKLGAIPWTTIICSVSKFEVQPIDQRRVSSYAVHRLTAYHNKSTPTNVIPSNSHSFWYTQK